MQFCDVAAVRSCDVIKSHIFFLLMASHRKEVQQRASRMASLCSTHQDASNDVHVTLEGTVSSRDLRSTDLDLIGQLTHISMRINEKISTVLLFLL